MLILMQLIKHFQSIGKIKELNQALYGVDTVNGLGLACRALDKNHGVEISPNQFKVLIGAMESGRFSEIRRLEKMIRGV